MRPQRWRSLGHVLVAAGENPAHHSHASYPTPLPMPDGSLRVFYSPRDAEGRSTIFSVDLAVSRSGLERLRPPCGPWLSAGARGAFDDAGTSVGWVGLTPGGGIECWYLGWSLGVSVPFRNFIGRAVAAPGASRFDRISASPVLDRSPEDPFTLGYPWLVDQADTRFAWYGTHRSWGPQGMEMDHVIRRAVSRDGGRRWTRDAGPALSPAGGEEWALSRPSVLRDEEGWHMWYCRRFEKYRLGYAQSADGRDWTRRDDLLEFTSEEAAWERGSRAYPAVFDHAGCRWMLYNGAGYGRTGFGLAVLED
ncbi:hypothetical protein [Roseococcus sp. YIM B11640]|uniref:hypothetical protein n=1 Tax=Roseococcus sp. YIM B11640 TaxID=3133973 RepID=UPI003C7D6200